MKKYLLYLKTAFSSLLAALILAGSCFSMASCTDKNVTADPDASSSENVSDTLPDVDDSDDASVDPLSRDGWKMNSIPAIQGGFLDKKKYNCGKGATETSTASYMHIVTQTSPEDFNAYKDLLSQNGFTCEYDAAVEKNLYACFSRNKDRVYFYYLHAFKQINVIQDTVSVSLEDFCYKLTPNTTENTTLYAYGFNGTGQLILLHNSDGSWFINDGCTNSLDSEKLWEFMLSKTQLADGEKLRISLWYITHGHRDHFPGVAQMIEKHTDQISLERIMWNFPDQNVISQGDDQRMQQLAMQTMVRKNYPNALYMKPHNGMRVTVGDAELFFLYTQEDKIPDFLSKEFTDYNSSSAVCMLNFSGKSVFLPGDTKMGVIDGGKFMCKAYSTKTFGCDIMQVSHHGYNKINSLHNILYPFMQYVLFENTYEESVGKNSGSGTSVALYNKMGADRCCFSDKTYAFTVVNGELVRTVESPETGETSGTEEVSGTT